ncbi:MAG TPA: hypothetical protein VEI48_01855 [Candidatus Sulfotelmatobacter sp.]|nr:hypothetical protein [Candidatus Sulfotelmatobacter sp.]
MSLLRPAAAPQPVPSPHPIQPVPGPSYQPGVCNIGPAEIRRRQAGAIAGTIVTIVVAVVIFALGLPHPVRLLIALPAAGALVGWLQAVLHFCVGFARLGVFNFGEIGPMERIADARAHRADQRRAAQMIGVALLGGLLIGLVAVLLP